MEWEIVYFNESVQKAISVMPPGIRASYIHLTERMLKFGPNLGLPHTRAMGGGLFELRMKSNEGVARVFFCALRNRRIAMLHSLIKKSQKTPGKDLKIARNRLEEVKRNADA
jgi:phage-related protein